MSSMHRQRMFARFTYRLRSGDEASEARRYGREFRPGENGKPAGVLPAAIHWPEGTIGGLSPDW